MTNPPPFASSSSTRLTTIFEISLYGMVVLSSAMLTLSEGFTHGPPPQAFTVLLVVAAYFLVDRWRTWVMPGWAAGGLGVVAVGVAFWETIRSVRFQGGHIVLPDERVLNLIFAGAHLLVFLTWIVLFLEKTSQQYWWLWALCVLEVAVGASQTTLGIYGVLLSLYLFLAVWTLSVFSLLQGQQQFESASKPRKRRTAQGLPVPPLSPLSRRRQKKRSRGLWCIPCWPCGGNRAAPWAMCSAIRRSRGSTRVFSAAFWAPADWPSCWPCFCSC